MIPPFLYLRNSYKISEITNSFGIQGLDPVCISYY